jgi:hypothetical protein
MGVFHVASPLVPFETMRRAKDLRTGWRVRFGIVPGMSRVWFDFDPFLVHLARLPLKGLQRRFAFAPLLVRFLFGFDSLANRPHLPTKVGVHTNFKERALA